MAKTPGAKRKLTDEQLEEIRAGKDKYFPVHFAERFGVKKDTIRNYMKAFTREEEAAAASKLL